MAKKKKGNTWQFFQMLGKTFMFPIALLSICGMLLGIGSAFTNESMIEAIPFLGNTYVNLFFQFMVQLGLFAFNNLGALFAMAIPLGLLKEEKEFGAFTGLVSFMAMHIGTNFYLSATDQLAAADQMSEAGQTMILGIQTYNTSVLGGIVAGLMAYALYRKLATLKIPEAQKYPDDDIPSERTVYRIMEAIGLSHRPKRKPNGITKAERNARKSEDLLKRDFTAERPLEKCVTDITEIPAKDGKLYVSAIFDCYDLVVLGLAMADNMKAELCVSTVKNACLSFPTIRGAIVHSDRGSQYTSDLYREELQNCGIIQSMNSDGGRCHDNARCEAMWARMKEELLYGRYDTKQMTMEELKTLIWRYYMIYWNTRRICSANGGLPPMVKRKQYYDTLGQVA